MSDLNRIRQQAAEWVVALQEVGSDERARLQAECEIWQAEDPRRRQVLEQIQQMWQAPEPALERRRKRRRQLTGLGSLLLLAWSGTQLPWAYWGADYRTAAGEIRAVPLPDGSQVVLNSNSAIDLDYTEGARTVKLVRGELLATVAKGRDAPFQVETRDISATALGTQYTVKLADTYSRVAVQESTVVVTSHNGGGALRLTSGQQADLNRGGLITQSTAPTHRPDWANGQLVFNSTPLPQVIERLGHHRAGILALDEALGASQPPPHFTGVLPADDSDAALALLSDALDLEVKHFTPWYVILSQK